MALDLKSSRPKILYPEAFQKEHKQFKALILPGLSPTDFCQFWSDREEMTPGASRPISYWFSTSLIDEIYRKEPGSFQARFLLISL